MKKTNFNKVFFALCLVVLFVVYSPSAMADDVTCTVNYKIEFNNPNNISFVGMFNNNAEGRAFIFCGGTDKIYARLYVKTKKKQWSRKHVKGSGEFSPVSDLELLFGTYTPQGGDTYSNGTATLKLDGKNGGKFKSLKIQRN